MKKLYPVLLLAAISFGCRKYKPEPLEVIPAATTASECTSKDYFAKLYDDLGGNALYPTPKGNLLTWYFQQSPQANVIAKLDTNGQVLWKKAMGDFDGIYMNFYPKTSSTFYAFYSEDKHVVYAELDEDLNVIKKLSLPYGGGSLFFDAPITKSHLVVAGIKKVRTDVRETLFITWIDSNLDKGWEYIDSSSATWYSGFKETDDAFYLWGSVSDLSVVVNYQYPAYGAIIKFDKAGNVLWKQTYKSGENGTVINSVYGMLFENGTITAKVSFIHPEERKPNTFLARMTIDAADGHMSNYHQVDEPTPNYIAPPPVKYYTADGYYTLTDTKNSAGNKQITLIKYNTAGTQQWQRDFNNGSGISNAGMTIMPGGNLYILGDVLYYDGKKSGAHSKKILIKANSLGESCF